MHGAYAHRHTALGQSRLDLGQGAVSLLGEQLLDEVSVRLDPARVPVAQKWRRRTNHLKTRSAKWGILQCR